MQQTNRKNVQIEYDLFKKLMLYFLMEDDAYYEEIKNGLEDKLDKLIKHDLYSQYKMAATEEEKEKARQEYLDKVGIPKTFRW